MGRWGKLQVVYVGTWMSTDQARVQLPAIKSFNLLSILQMLHQSSIILCYLRHRFMLWGTLELFTYLLFEFGKLGDSITVLELQEENKHAGAIWRHSCRCLTRETNMR